jgi:hypothetical protein
MKPFTLLVAAAVVAAPLAAQGPPPWAGRADSARRPMAGMPMMGMHPMMGMDMMGMHMMGMHMQGMGGMHAAMVFAPAYLLEHKDKLALTPQQVTRLEALRDSTKAMHDRAAATARTAGDSLGAALAVTTPDTALARRLFRAHHDAMGEAHWTMLRAGVQAKAVLTATQRERVAGWADVMHQGPH